MKSINALLQHSSLMTKIQIHRFVIELAAKFRNTEMGKTINENQQKHSEANIWKLMF